MERFDSMAAGAAVTRYLTTAHPADLSAVFEAVDELASAYDALWAAYQETLPLAEIGASVSGAHDGPI